VFCLVLKVDGKRVFMPEQIHNLSDVEDAPVHCFFVFRITTTMHHIFTKLSLVAAFALLLQTHAFAQTRATNYAHNIVMVDIPAGRFIMGACLSAKSSPDCVQVDPDASPNEEPVRAVEVAAFQLGRTEVTLGQFKAFIRATGRTDLLTLDFVRANAQGNNAPVVYVSWHDAQAFVDWLNRTEGSGWRLPTEAEWEYACRAGARGLYCATGAQASDGAWHMENSAGRQRVVATRQPNVWGLFDMSGNAYEWVQDCWHDSYRGAPVQAAQPWTTGCHADTRVLRGGAWSYSAVNARATARNDNAPESRSFNFGFRLARTL
jgi:formylglycine-generating enzyme required for sulfatase activity